MLEEEQIQPLSHIEQLIYNEVASILAHNNVADRDNLYSNITKSIWKGDTHLQVYFLAGTNALLNCK